MELKINHYTITGTAEEMWEFLRLADGWKETVKQDPAEQEKPAREVKAKPKSAPRKEVDWAKARALRNAGWSYDKIGEELRVSGVTVSANLKQMEEEEAREA